MPVGEIPLQEPPSIPEVSGGAWVNALTYLPMAISSGAMMLLFIGPSSAALGYLIGGAMVLSAVAALVGQVLRNSGDRKRRIGNERRDYLRYLSQIRRRTRQMVSQQRSALFWEHPTPAGLWSLAGTPRMWERRASAENFGEVRIAQGDQRFVVRVRPPQTKPVEDLDPVCALSLRRFVEMYSV